MQKQVKSDMLVAERSKALSNPVKVQYGPIQFFENRNDANRLTMKS